MLTLRWKEQALEKENQKQLQNEVAWPGRDVIPRKTEGGFRVLLLTLVASCPIIPFKGHRSTIKGCFLSGTEAFLPLPPSIYPSMGCPASPFQTTWVIKTHEKYGEGHERERERVLGKKVEIEGERESYKSSREILEGLPKNADTMSWDGQETTHVGLV